MGLESMAGGTMGLESMAGGTMGLESMAGGPLGLADILSSCDVVASGLLNTDAALFRRVPGALQIGLLRRPAPAKFKICVDLHRTRFATVCVMSVVLKLTITAYSTCGIAISRDSIAESLSDILCGVAATTRALCAHAQAPTCALVVVQPMSAKRRLDVDAELPVGNIDIINICGRITHLHASGCVVHPACEPLMVLNNDSFGLRTGVFTIFGNFMTSESNRTTLFRGARRSSDVLMVADHIFKPDCVEAIIMHMVVAKARLPHAVIVAAEQFDLALGDRTRWLLTSVSISEDMTYMRPLHLQLLDGRGTTVLLHIYSSGVVFFFVTCPDTPLSVAEERRIAAQCADIYVCLAAVC